jgi:hypothetical protein
VVDGKKKINAKEIWNLINKAGRQDEKAGNLAYGSQTTFQIGLNFLIVMNLPVEVCELIYTALPCQFPFADIIYLGAVSQMWRVPVYLRKC